MNRLQFTLLGLMILTLTLMGLVTFKVFSVTEHQQWAIAAVNIVLALSFSAAAIKRLRAKTRDIRDSNSR